MSGSRARRLLAAVIVFVSAAAPIVRAYPIAEERKLGERFAIEAATQLPIVREPTVVDYLNRIGGRIVAKLEAPQPFEYRFQLVRDVALNAFAVPGGFVYVNSGLLLRVANESELAGVIAHEIGHTHAHHIVRQQEKTRLLSYAAIAGLLLSMVHPAIGAAAMGADATASLKYQREFEQEADYLGVRYMREAGFDPHGMLSFMKTLWNEQRFLPNDQVPPYMLSHPMTDERIANLESATKGIPQTPGAERPTFALLRVQAIVEALTGGTAQARKRSEAARPPAGEAAALLGVSRLYGGDAPGAIEPLERASHDGVKGIVGDLGLARLRAGDLDGAEIALRAAIEADPDDAVARANLGRVRLAKKDFAGAIQDLARAASESSAVDVVESDLGQAYGKSGNLALGFYHLARGMEMRGEVEPARAAYDKAYKLLRPGTPEGATALERRDALAEIAGHRILP